MRWWRGEVHIDPRDPYAAHVASIRHLVPAELLRLDESQFDVLHDAKLRELHIDAPGAELKLVLDGDDGRGGFQRLRLTYRNVSSLKSVADPDIGLPGPHGYGDLGYSEIDVMDDGGLEHRLRFSSGIELHIRFANFSLAVDGG